MNSIIKEPSGVSLSYLDEQRFGIRSARAMQITANALPEIMEYSQQQMVQFLIARCSTKDLSTVQALERAGFRR